MWFTQKFHHHGNWLSLGSFAQEKFYLSCTECFSTWYLVPTNWGEVFLTILGPAGRDSDGTVTEYSDGSRNAGSHPCESSCRSGSLPGPGSAQGLAQHSILSAREEHTSSSTRQTGTPRMSTCLQKLHPAIVPSRQQKEGQAGSKKYFPLHRVGGEQSQDEGFDLYFLSIWLQGRHVESVLKNNDK